MFAGELIIFDTLAEDVGVIGVNAVDTLALEVSLGSLLLLSPIFGRGMSVRPELSFLSFSDGTEVGAAGSLPGSGISGGPPPAPFPPPVLPVTGATVIVVTEAGRTGDLINLLIFCRPSELRDLPRLE